MMKQDKYERAVEYASQVLEHEPANHKALLRRAKVEDGPCRGGCRLRVTSTPRDLDAGLD
jgi:hypothetical protein